MLLIWMMAWTIFSANPMAQYQAERTVSHADIQTRLAASRALPFSL
ncbi:MAG: hypothetical protein IV086_04000 [Hyphomonadaceae bacterium]|nr:MAG: hypothetical protein FD160_2633 [Caulobacteraceae bacterium]MBT9444845.1 hypothetical protein [Hyphomonadaceae bacterium]